LRAIFSSQIWKESSNRNKKLAFFLRSFFQGDFIDYLDQLTPIYI
jgi:hypothetical protein